MYDDAGFIVLSSCSAMVILSSFAALIWAAVQDGRYNDEQQLMYREQARRASTAAPAAKPSDVTPAG